jgi:hypothetical protein
MIAPVNGSTASLVSENAAINTPTASRSTPSERAYRGRIGERMPKPTMMMNVPAREARTSGIRRMSRYPSRSWPPTPPVYEWVLALRPPVPFHSGHVS